MEKVAVKTYIAAMGKGSRADILSGRMKNFLIRLVAGKLWGKYRSLPQFANESFRKQWKKKRQ